MIEIKSNRINSPILVTHSVGLRFWKSNFKIAHVVKGFQPLGLLLGRPMGQVSTPLMTMVVGMKTD
jgi:hypothetical protein